MVRTELNSLNGQDPSPCPIPPRTGLVSGAHPFACPETQFLKRRYVVYPLGFAHAPGVQTSWIAVVPISSNYKATLSIQYQCSFNIEPP